VAHHDQRRTLVGRADGVAVRRRIEDRVRGEAVLGGELDRARHREERGVDLDRFGLAQHLDGAAREVE